MKQFIINNIYKATEVLSENKDLSCDVKWKVYKLRKMLLPHIEFYNETYEGIRQKYSKYADENGKVYGIHLDSFAKDMTELNNMEKDIEEIQKIKIKISELSTLDVHAMEALDEVVEFIE